MSRARRHRSGVRHWIIGLSATLLALPGFAAEKPPVIAAEQVDQDLLEFLGSVDTQVDENDWFEFLRSTDIGKLAKAKSKPTPPPQESKG